MICWHQFLDAIKCEMHPNFRNFRMQKKCILELRKYSISCKCIPDHPMVLSFPATRHIAFEDERYIVSAFQIILRYWHLLQYTALILRIKYILCVYSKSSWHTVSTCNKVHSFWGSNDFLVYSGSSCGTVKLLKMLICYNVICSMPDNRMSVLDCKE
jgi:hypothetical protein